MSFQNYVIKKGNHFSVKLYSFIPLMFKISLFTKNEMKFRFMFGQGCDQLVDQINKLYGFTLGWFVHRNSVRIGWKWSYEESKVQLFAYWYVDGIRKWLYLYSVGLYEAVDATIIRHEDGSVDIRLFSVNEYLLGGTTIEFASLKNKNVIKWRLFPYFGGKIASNQTVSVYVDEK